MKKIFSKQSSTRTAMMLLVVMLTSVTAWADDPWTAAGGTGGSGTSQDPYFVNMPAIGTATTLDAAATLSVPSGITTFKLYGNNGPNQFYSKNYKGYLIITVPTDYLIQITGDYNGRHPLYVYDGSTDAAPTLLNGVKFTNNINVNSTGNVILVSFETDNMAVNYIDLTINVVNSKDLQTGTLSGLQNYYLWSNGSAINIDYTVKDALNTTLVKGTDYTETIKKDGVAVNSVTDVGKYTLEIKGRGSYSGAITASFIVYKMLSSGSGTKADPYLISNVNDWMSFCCENNAATYWASGVYVKMTADVGTTENPVTTMVGTSETNAFQGTFDGGGHTLTIQYGTADSRSITRYTAPFSYVSGALIKNLHTAGYIYSSINSCTGMVGWDYSTNILNCRSSVVIDATVNGQYGFACNYQHSNITIENCLFDGQIINTGYGAGFASNYANSSVQIKNCLFAPADMQGLRTFYTFVDESPYTITNSYEKYTNNAITSQGTNASGMTPAELAAALGFAWEVRNEGGVDKVLPILNTNHIGGATVTGIEPSYKYTGSAIAVSYSLTDVEGNDMTENTDYTVSLKCNGSSVATVQTAGDYIITFTGTGSYTGTKEATFKVIAYPDGLLVDNDYAVGEKGFFYVNMPATGSTSIDLTDQTDGFTFKVYDNGGKNASYGSNCSGTLVLTAASGYVLQVTGSAPISDISDYLSIYNGTNTSSPVIFTQDGKDYNRTDNIGILISPAQNLTFLLHSDYAQENAGIDLTVKLVDVNTTSTVSITNPQEGEVSSSPTSAKVNTEITLTATPGNGYMLENINIKDAENNKVNYSGGKWYSNNTATFTMPGSNVTVTSSFTTKKSVEDGLYINMPTDAVVTAIIPEGVTSFRLYDDGGENYNYSRVCDGTLILTAPTGYKLKLTGFLLTFEQDVVALNVYDGTEAIDEKRLLTDIRSLTDGYKFDIDDVYSTSNTMRVRFNNNSSPENTFAGLCLTVELIDGNQSYAVTVNNTDSHGTIVSDKTTAKTSETVTLTATADDGYIVNSISVTDGNKSINVEGNQWYNFYTDNKATFVMPNSEVTVTSTFTNDKTAEGGLHIDLKRDGIINLAIPEDIVSFKVYDDGGASGKYSKNCRSVLVLTAPEGCHLKLTGTVTTDGNDNLRVYEGTAEDVSKLLYEDIGNASVHNIGTIVSTGSSMYIRFWSNSDNTVAAGLDLKVEVAITKYSITFDNSGIGGNASATVSEAAMNQPVELTLTPASADYLPEGLDITSTLPVNLTWTGSFSNTATMVMPSAHSDVTPSVTVTPSFTNIWTAGGGLLALIPRSGNASATIPAGVESFKIYDHSGLTGNYDNNTEGSLTLTAPTGYKHQLTGTVTTNATTDYLTVTDDAASSTLIDQIRSTMSGESVDIGTVASTGETITLNFLTGSGTQYAGLNLTSALVPIEYTINYNGLLGASLATTNPTTYNVESAAITLNNPTRKGYTFAGWTGTGLDAASTSVTIAQGSTGTREYTATWTPINYNITYNGLEGATLATPNPTTYNIESAAITLNNPTKKDYTFAGWTGTGLSAASTSVTIAKGSTGARDYTATWTPINYSITYNGVEGATFATANPATYTIESAAITLNNPTKTGYEFVGWYDNAEFTGNAITGVAITSGSTGAKIFYARWRKLILHYSIHFVMPRVYPYTGEPIEPTIRLDDEDTNTTLVENTDYTVEYSNNRLPTQIAKIVITGIGNYAGTRTEYFEIKKVDVPIINFYGSLTLYDKNGIYSADINGDNPEGIKLPDGLSLYLDDVTFFRDFDTPYATICLPFPVVDLVTSQPGRSWGTFYEFTGVNDNYEVVMTEMEIEEGVVSENPVLLEANKPYIYKPYFAEGESVSKLSFVIYPDPPLNNISFPLTTDEVKVSGTAPGNEAWSFCGTYKKKEFSTIPEGKAIYFFAAEPQGSVSPGDFVKVNASPKTLAYPFRAYIEYDRDDLHLPATARGASATEALPDKMKVVLKNADGTTTVIGTVSLEYDSDEWYSLDGRKLNGKPTKKGLYINNGNKIIIK